MGNVDRPAVAYKLRHVSTAGLISQLRERAGLSARRLAERAGLATTTITRAEAGRCDMTLETLRQAALAAGFHLDVRLSKIPTLAAAADIAGDETANWAPIVAATDWAAQFPEDASAVIADRPVTEDSRALNLLAGTAAIIAERCGAPTPAWAEQIEPLSQPWSAGTPAMVARARRSAPPQFLKRNIWFTLDSVAHAWTV